MTRTSLPGQSRLPDPQEPRQLSQVPLALLDTTMDQLRTLVTVHDAGTALRAARALGREQASVQKQLDTLNRNFAELCGEPLVLKQGRGKAVLFTKTGKAVVRMAHDTLADWLDGIQESRRRFGDSLTVGTTRYTLGWLTSAGERLSDEFQRRGVELKVVHLRTKDLLSALKTKQVDLVCGSAVVRADNDPNLAGLDVLQRRRTGLSLMTNLPADRLPQAAIGASDLPQLPLVVPQFGLVAGFLRGWFGVGYRGKLDIIAEIDSLEYGFDLLRSDLLRGCLLVTRGIGEAALDGRLGSGAGLRVIDLVSDMEPRLDVLTGVFARAGDRAAVRETHPLNLLWAAFAEGIDQPWSRTGIRAP